MLASFNIKKLQIRALSAAVLAPSILLILVLGGIVFKVLMVICAIICLQEWFELSMKTKRKAIFLVIGSLYILGALYSCYLLREQFSYYIAVLFVVMVWGSDIGAYFFGKMIGGPKMAAGVSPNKTWAGMVGAMISPALIIVLWAYGTHLFFNGGETVNSLGHYVVLGLSGLFVGAFGQIGDLIISFAKRQAGIKDTGSLIPGHGGLLDRIDAMLLAGPYFLIVAMSLFHV